MAGSIALTLIVAAGALAACAVLVGGMALIAAGNSNREIADRLVVSLNTVKKHTSHIFDKLGVSSRAEATRVAIERGFVLATAG